MSLSDVSFGLQKWGDPVNVPKPSPPGLVPKSCRRSKPPVSVGDVEDGGLRSAHSKPTSKRDGIHYFAHRAQRLRRKVTTPIESVCLHDLG